MSNNKDIQDFVQALANDDYVKADEVFPKVVKNTWQNIINKKKPDVQKTLSAAAEKVAVESLAGTEDKKG